MSTILLTEMGPVPEAAKEAVERTPGDYVVLTIIGLGVFVLVATVLGLIGFIAYASIRDWWEKTPRRIYTGNAQDKLNTLYHKYDTEAAVRKCLRLGAQVSETHIYLLSIRYSTRNLSLLLEHDSSSINAVPYGKDTNALGAAIRADHSRDIIRLLRSHGAHPLPATVQWAVQHQSEYAMDLLRESGFTHTYGTLERPPLFDALNQRNPDYSIVEYLLDRGAHIAPVVGEFQQAFARSGSMSARKALSYLRDIQNARARLDGLDAVDIPNIWDHLDQESSQE